MTRFVYNLLMNPITFHAFVMVAASSLNYWPSGLTELRVKGGFSLWKGFLVVFLGKGEILGFLSWVGLYFFKFGWSLPFLTGFYLLKF